MKAGGSSDGPRTPKTPATPTPRKRKATEGKQEGDLETPSKSSKPKKSAKTTKAAMDGDSEEDDEKIKDEPVE